MNLQPKRTPASSRFSPTRFLFFALGPLLLGGCWELTTKEPLSDDPQPIDQEHLEGAWTMDDQVYHVRFGKDGVARIGGLDWEQDQFQLGQMEAIVTEGKPHNHLSLRLMWEGEWMEEYYLLAYTFSDDGDLVLWAPDVDHFEEVVEQGKLEGVADGETHQSDLMLTTPPAKLMEFLNAPENGNLFDYTDPMVLRRVASYE